MIGPQLIWSDHGECVVGVTVTGRHDPGTGPDRYRRAHEWLLSTDASRAWASFTFDPEQTGSIVLTVDERGSRAQPEASVMSPGYRVVDDGVGRWRRGFDRVMEMLSTGVLDKVVLARQIQLELLGETDPRSMVAALANANPAAYVFAIEGLVGASPELLVRVTGDKVVSQVLAGTALDEKALANDLIEEEHRLAALSVSTVLSNLVENLDVSRDSVPAGPVVHAATTFSGSRHTGVGITDLLGAMHPTAAVGGWPSDPALEAIRDVEPLDRGRFAGPIGWFDREGQGVFALALRCALIDGDEARLYAGGGLVRGATAEDELRETDLKLSAMLAILGGA